MGLIRPVAEASGWEPELNLEAAMYLTGVHYLSERGGGTLGSVAGITSLSTLGISELADQRLDLLMPTVFSQQVHQAAITKGAKVLTGQIAADIGGNLDSDWLDGSDGGWGAADVFNVVKGGLQLYTAYQQTQGGPMTDSGDPVGNGNGGGGDGGMQDVALPAAVAGAGIWLGALLARTFGKSMASRVITGANGVRVRMNQLWPLVRRYGPQTVAGGLGVSIGALGQMLANAPTSGARRRSRGISASDIKRTKRTLGQIRKISYLAGIGRGSSRRPRSRGYYHYHRGRR